ncbi:MAG: mycothiol synthase [Acidimicrobiales bacterium]
MTADVHLEIKRRLGEADIAALSTLLHLATLADGHRPLGEHTWLDLVHGGRTGFAGFMAIQPGHGHPVGYAQVSRGAGAEDSWAVELVIDPHHRSSASTVGTDLLRAALDEVAREGGGHVHLWVPKPRSEHDAMADANGLLRGRELLHMRRPLPLPELEGSPSVPFRTRPFQVGKDEEAWLEVNNRAFARHPEQGGWDSATLQRREKEAWFDPAGLLLHERDGQLAGFCWTKVHDDLTPPVGEIYVLAVDPDFQGQGLARPLATTGLRWLADKGLATAILYVDSANEPAVALYRHLGFDLDHVDRAYVGDVPAT